MIILELTRRHRGPVPDAIFFVGVDHAEGFELVMPVREWRYLGEPDRIQFVASGEALGVRAGWVEEVRAPR